MLIIVIILLDIDRNHVLQHPSSQLLTLVRHGTVLNGSSKDNNITSFTFDLDSVGMELFLVLWIGGAVVRVRTKGGASVFFGEICQEGDKLGGKRRGCVHNVGVSRGIE